MITLETTKEELRTHLNNEMIKFIEQREMCNYQTVQTFPVLRSLASLWREGNHKRVTKVSDSYLLLTLLLQLAPEDTVSKSIHLFLEEAVDLSILPEDVFEKLDTNQTTIDIFFYSNLYFHLCFDPEPSEHCTILTEEKREKRVRRKIIC